MKLLRQEQARCFAWTIRDIATTIQVLAYGVDGLITDYPEVLRRVLRYR
ncbi:MAG TPA: glycerophosphodiester phosphodiesterase family protein [Pontibacter sp.]